MYHNKMPSRLSSEVNSYPSMQKGTVVSTASQHCMQMLTWAAFHLCRSRQHMAR